VARLLFVCTSVTEMCHDFLHDFCDADSFVISSEFKVHSNVKLNVLYTRHGAGLRHPTVPCR
jgi:hypothetical protein